MKKLRVLIACEFSGIVRDAFIARGHDAMSCDLLQTERPGPHYQGDVRDILNDGWGMMIAFPPCTYLCTAGQANKTKLNQWEQRETETKKAIAFVKLLYYSPVQKVAIENPVGVLSSRWRKPNQIVEPYYFGDNDKKPTCFWLRGLPRLNGLVEVARNLKKYQPEPYRIYPSGRKSYFGQMVGDKYRFHPMRGHFKSRSFKGIANAMAAQWG